MMNPVWGRNPPSPLSPLFLENLPVRVYCGGMDWLRDWRPELTDEESTAADVIRNAGDVRMAEEYLKFIKEGD